MRYEVNLPFYDGTEIPGQLLIVICFSNFLYKSHSVLQISIYSRRQLFYGVTLSIFVLKFFISELPNADSGGQAL